MKNKFGSVLLSVLVAFGLWLYVITAVSPGSADTYYNIPVVWENESVLNEYGLMLTDKSTNAVTMRLSGNRSDLSKVNNNNITIKVDLSKIHEPGENIALNYTYSFPGDVPSNAFVVESKNPGNIIVSVAPRVTKEVPVEVKWIGFAPEGFMSDRENRVLDYSTVTLTGPDTVVGQVEKAVIAVDLNEQRENINDNYVYTLCDAEDEPVDARLITTNVDQIHLEVKIQRVKDIKLVYTLVEGGGALESNARVALSAESIRVSGSEAALDAMGDTLNIGTIHLADVDKMENIPFEIVLPEGITNRTGVTTVIAEVKLSGLSTKEIMVESINTINVPENAEIELITEKMTVVVRGPSDLIAKMTGNDISVAVDFTDAEAGTSTYKAIVTFSEGFEKAGVFHADPISASVTLK